MTRRITPMIHVQDVRRTIDWYESLGFQIISTGDDGSEMVWAELSFGEGRVMFSAGGKPSAQDRREVDLYVHVENVDEHFQKLKGIARVQEELHDTFYGMREFIVRDVNGFWITFGEPIGRTR
jgi:uncharacterized glyoxalase superfamily protein PhnB